MKKAIRSVFVAVGSSALLAFASCSSTSANQDYATYPTSGYGDYGADTTTNANDGNGAADQSYATSTNTGAGAGGAYPTTPSNYGTDYGSTGGGASTPTASTSTASGKTHTVQRGETLYRISKNYGTTVANIKAANGLNTDLIKVGDVLTVR